MAFLAVTNPAGAPLRAKAALGFDNYRLTGNAQE
jgi:hypothetical protein